MRPKVPLRVASNGAISRPNIGPSCRNPNCRQTGSRKSCGPFATSSRSKAFPNSPACSVESSKPLIECSDVPNPVQPSPEPHPASLIQQEVSAEREIEIPEEVRQVYAQWRPTPLFRARRLEKFLDTPAKIYYKYEGVSPAGSHKPNTAVAQA